MTDFVLIVTAAGAAAQAAALAASEPLAMKWLAVGDGDGAYHVPTGAETALEGEQERVLIDSWSVDAVEPSWVHFTAVVPADSGGYHVREVGLFTEDGVLFAVGPYPETYKSLEAEGFSFDLVIDAVVAVDGVPDIAITFDPSAVYATRQWVSDHDFGPEIFFMGQL